VVNGVKQGGVLSPVLFCVYKDGLLFALCATKTGCFIMVALCNRADHYIVAL